MTNPSMKPLLIKFDLGLLKRIELEVQATSNEAGRDAHRTDVIRDLITESLDARCVRRNEAPPYVVAVSDAELEAGGEVYEVGPTHEAITIESVDQMREAFLSHSVPAGPIGPVELHKPIEVPSKTTSLPDGSFLVEVAEATIKATTEATTKAITEAIRLKTQFDLDVLKASVAESRLIKAQGEDLGGVGVGGALVEARRVDEEWPDHLGISLKLREGHKHEMPCPGCDAIANLVIEGKTAEGVEAGASVEGDACEVRSGGNVESAAADAGVNNAASLGEVTEAGAGRGVEEVPVPEVGQAGGRGWLGGSVKPIGLYEGTQ